MTLQIQDALPPPQPDQTYVSISALEGGMIPLFEKYFVYPSSPNAVVQAPSLAFLITHPSTNALSPGSSTAAPFRMLFDLGLRSCIENYVPAIQEHINERLRNGGKYAFTPGVLDSLRAGSIDPTKIHAVTLSHVHYDHHGDTAPFTAAQFIIGPGATGLMHNGVPNPSSHMHFDPDAMPFDRTLELPALDAGATFEGPSHWRWQPLGPFPHSLDLFSDGSVYLVHAPGHLPGHVNLLARVAPGRWVYLAGDAAHDMRLLTGEKEIATWKGEDGREHCIHYDREEARLTIERIRRVVGACEEKGDSVEVVLAHGHEWYHANKHRILPGML